MTAKSQDFFKSSAVSEGVSPKSITEIWGGILRPFATFSPCLDLALRRP